MTNRLIVLAGATGDLGGRIAQELRERDAAVRALVRPGTADDKLGLLAKLGVTITPVDFGNAKALARATEGASMVISALSGLRPTIIDTQSKLLDAAVEAGVPRFMPSDFAIDFTQIPDGLNRNLNLRNEFRERVDKARIRSTSILNGAFMDMLTGTAPFILFGMRRILVWGDPDQLMDWTTIADTARYAAQAALDEGTPRFLRVAGEQLSARRLGEIMSELTGHRHGFLRPGGPGLLRFLIGVTKATSPKTDDIYPAWQGMQYMHNMYAGLGKFHTLDNDRYPMEWTQAREVLGRYLLEKRAMDGKSQISSARV